VTVSQADLEIAKTRAGAAAKLAQAKELIPKGKLDEAIALADEARGRDPKNAEAAALSNKWKTERSTIETQLGKARSLMGQQKFKDAAREMAVAKNLHGQYKPLLDAEKELADAAAKYESGSGEGIRQVKLGDDLYENAKYQAAIAAYNKALAADPGSAPAYAGRCLAKRGISDLTALADCDTALQIDPNNGDAYRGRSMAKRVNNDLPGALSDANRAVDLSPGNYRSYLTRGLAKDGLNDRTGALADYDRSIQLNPNYASSYVYRGIAREHLGDVNGALADWETAISLDPANEAARNNLQRVKGGANVEPVAAIFYPLDLTPIGGKKGQSHTLKGVEVDDGSYARLKSTDEKRLTYTIQIPKQFQAAGIAIVSNLDDSINVLQGMTVARMTVVKSSGEESFDIQAGVHSSEWNAGDGPKHKVVDPLFTFSLARSGMVAAIRFDYVETNAEKWWGHAPGFCLKGVTLVGASAAPVTKPPVNPINIGDDRLGREWSETENGFIGRWVRRGNSNIWDASWNNGPVAELSISIAGDKVTINRRDVAGPVIGLIGMYEGTLAPDGTMHGTETVTFAGQLTSSRFDWQGRIVAPVNVPPPPVNPPTGSGSRNLALNRPAKQSSISSWSHPNGAQGGVDGVIGADYGFHTEIQANPWWQVDLGAVTSLSEIRIFNRHDCCLERARTIQVLLSNDGVTWNRAFSNPGTIFGADGSPLIVPVKGLSARFVRLQLAETNYLHLNEVEVYGTDSAGAGVTPTDTELNNPNSATGGKSSVVDTVLRGSLSHWGETHDPTNVNPVFSSEEITIGGGSLAIRTRAVGNTFASCETKWIKRIYDTGLLNSDNALVEFTADFAFNGTTYNLPSIGVELLDVNGRSLGMKQFFGKNVIGEFNRSQLQSTGHIELDSASGVHRVPLSRIRANVNFSKIAIYLMNYTCQGENSIVFKRLEIKPVIAR
jgi:tetratricopeptide (TPR) repeat protein